MTSEQFVLQPFALEEAPPELHLSGQIQRLNSILTVQYVLSDPLGLVKLEPSAVPTRKFALWDATCFELFLSAGQERYWEFNLSPAGHWNVYRFDGYRCGMLDELALPQLPFSVERSAETFCLNLALDLTPIIPADQSIAASITAVILSKQDSVSYWALTHCAPQADFHQRDSFILAL